MTIKLDYSDISFRNDGKLKLLILVGTRPEIIRLAAVITKCRKYFDCILAHTGQNYDYNLNGIFFRDLGLADPDVYLNAVGDDLGATVGNIINCSYKLMNAIKPIATNSRKTLFHEVSVSMVIVQVAGPEGKVMAVAQKTNGLAHAKWVCRYHIVFTPKE